MNKKIIAVAVATIMAAPVAMADVKVYGIAQLEIAQTEKDGDSANDKNEVADSKNSRLGFKWSEALGNGMKAVGEFEFAPNLLDGAKKATNNTAGIYARQANMGLKGGFGEVRMGTIKQPYKYNGGVKYDNFVATKMEARSGNGGMIKSHFGQGGYMANAIHYKNKVGKVSFEIAYAIEKDSDADTNYKGSEGDYSAALKVNLGKGMEVGFAASQDKYDTTEAADTAGEKNSKIFGKYTTGAHTIKVQLETSDVAADKKDAAYTFLSYNLKMGKNLLVAQYGTTDSDTDTNDVTYVAVGAFHKMSKSTSAFVGYRSTDTDATTDAGDSTALSVGLKTKF